MLTNEATIKIFIEVKTRPYTLIKKIYNEKESDE